MKIYDYIHKDHKKVSALFKKISAAKTAKMKNELYQKIFSELTLHLVSEENTFYLTLEKYSQSEPKVEHGEEEHTEIKQAMNKLKKLSATSIDWLVQFGVLKQLVEHHVNDEETRIWAAAKQVLSSQQENQLTIEMEQYKQKMLGNSDKKEESLGLAETIMEIFGVTSDSKTAKRKTSLSQAKIKTRKRAR